MKSSRVGGRSGVLCGEDLHRSLVRTLDEAVLDGHLDRNPPAGTKRLRAPQRARRYLTKVELCALIANCPGHFRPFLVAG